MSEIKVKKQFLSEFESKYVLAFRNWKDNFLKLIIDALVKWKIKPIQLSLIGLALTLATFPFLKTNLVVVFILFLLSAFFDNLDGSLARRLNDNSKKGFYIDLFCDHLGFFAVILFAIYHGLADGFLASLYLLNYIFVIFGVLIIQSLKIETLSVFRSKYYFYLSILLLIWNVDIIEGFLLFMSIYMLIVNVYNYYLIYRNYHA